MSKQFRVMAVLSLTISLAQMGAAGTLYSEVVLHPGAHSPDYPVVETGTTSASGSLTSIFGDSIYTASGQAISDYGTLKMYATLSLSNYLPNSYHSEGCGVFGCYVADPVYVTASFEDEFTILGGTGTGYLFLTLDMDGTTTKNSDLGPSSTVQGALSVRSGANYYLNDGFFGGSHSFTTQAIPFTYGTPFSLTVGGYAFSVAVDTLNETGGNNYNHSGTADFLNTLTLASLSIASDMSGTNPVAASVTSGSGTEYPVAAVEPVPEPATWVLVASVLPALVYFRRRRVA